MSNFLKKIVDYNRTHYNCVFGPIMTAVRNEADKRGIYSISSRSWGMINFQESNNLPKFDVVVSGLDAHLESEMFRCAMPSTIQRACQDMWRYIYHEDLRVEGGKVYCHIQVRLNTLYGDAAYDRLLHELYGKFEKYYRAFYKDILPKLKGVSKNQIIWHRDKLQKKAS